MSISSVARRLAHNAGTAARNPSMLAEYAAYQCSRLVHGGRAVRRFPKGARITGFTGFSEYHSCAAAISHSEELFLDTYPFPPGDMLDIGANLGVFSAGLCRKFPTRRLFAFEPNASTFASLQQNLRLNDCANAKAYPFAVAERDGEIAFALDESNRAMNHIAYGAGQGVASVHCVSVDSFLDDNSIESVALMKVDVEGFETKVFRGARKALAEGIIAVVYFEVCPVIAERAGFNPSDSARVLLEAGYKLFGITKTGALAPAELAELAGAPYANWVALK